jgi:DNA excision repair protein ERCC-2
VNKIKLGVTEFALPAPRRGSIDLYSGFARGAERGLEIHQEVQRQRRIEFSDYQAEVAVTREFRWEGYEFEICGRMDGFYTEAGKIEEIKSCFNIYDLMRKLKDSEGDHPYLLQLRTYGYFYWLEHQKVPELNLHLVSSRNGEGLDYSVHLNVRDYEGWLKRRSKELAAAAKTAEQRRKRRQKAAENMAFPFEQARQGQHELMAAVEDSMKEGRPLMLQAPTGLGKTLGVLFPSLREALGRGQKLLYLTPKNSQHAVAEEAVVRIREKGAAVKSLTLTAKSKLCFKNEALCNPDFCEYAKDHYTKVAENEVMAELKKKRKLTAKKIRAVAEKHQVCPYEIQLEAATDVDAVICDYNYVFSPVSPLRGGGEGDWSGEGEPNLVIDEAHNLPSRSMDYYSPSLSVDVLRGFEAEFTRIPAQFQEEGRQLLAQCIAVVEGSGPARADKPCRIDPPSKAFLKQDEKLRTFLSTYLKSDVEIAPKDPVLNLSFYWSQFTEALEFIAGGKEEFFTTFYPAPIKLKITCCDASAMLKEAYGSFRNVVAFSATLKPFDFYARLSGLLDKDFKTAEFVSPFPADRRKVLIIPQISSKYSQREKNYPRVAEAIQRISALKKGNYFVFFPSFDFMEKVASRFQPPPGFQMMQQRRHMKKNEIDEMLDRLKDPEVAHVFFAVQGGVFSEGVDYPGEMIIGAFVVGPPLPNFDSEREGMKTYYQRRYAAGFDYAYTYPAMAKAVQAAGRVIRSETDRGLIVLMDDRFTQGSYFKSMPQDWFEKHPQELVSESILRDVTRFWSECPNERAF